MSEKTVILGAGLSGLSAAFHLKKNYEIYEKESEVGGLCRSIRRDGFIFDYSGHYLHFKNRYAKELVFRLLKGRLHPNDRKAWIYRDGRLIRYPYQAHSGPSNFQEWLFERFGCKAANEFLIPYNKKFWSYPLNRLTTEWADRFIPVPKYPKRIGYNAQFFYTTQGGISALAEAFRKEVCNLRLHSEAVRIDLKRRVIGFRGKGWAKYDKLISTVPLPELGQMVGCDWEGLKYTSLLILNIGIKDRGTSRAIHWIYYPEKRCKFYRIGFASNIAPHLAPKGMTSMYVETAYRTHRPGVGAIISDIIKAGAIESKEDVKCLLPIDLKYASVIYDEGRKALTEEIFPFLHRHNVYPIGRYGRWEYMSMEDAILDGRRIALELA